MAETKDTWCGEWRMMFSEEDCKYRGYMGKTR